jgi:hypothetical protein
MDDYLMMAGGFGRFQWFSLIVLSIIMMAPSALIYNIEFYIVKPQFCGNLGEKCNFE